MVNPESKSRTTMQITGIRITAATLKTTPKTSTNKTSDIMNPNVISILYILIYT